MTNTRREFMQRSVFAGAGALTAPITARGDDVRPDTLPFSVKDAGQKPFDIVVIGAGTAGTIAAIQAGRLGLRTLVVEKNGLPGGTTTMAAVNFPGIFHAWGRQVISGIGWELVSRTVALCGERLPDFSRIPERHWEHQVRVNRAVYAALACEEFLKAGVTVLFHTMPAGIEECADGFRVRLCTKTGPMEVEARTVIDASGDAVAAGMAGYPLVEQDIRQPGTLIFSLKGYVPGDLDMNALQKSFQRALESGELTEADRAFVRHDIRGVLRSGGDNCTHVPGIDGRTSAGRSEAELKSRVSLLRIYRFLRGQPGLENLQIDFMAPECGIRETVTIRGEATITGSDYVAGRLWEDAVCYSFYPIDLHLPAGGGIDTRPLPPETFPTVPRGALVPQGSKHMLVAGRCLSSDREANSALRVQATSMACGQAAAVIAAAALRRNVPVMEADMEEIRAMLRQHQAIVPETGGPGRA